MARIEPTVGRIVYYWPAQTPEDDSIMVDMLDQPCAAQIVCVHPGGRTVNLDVTDHAGGHHFRVVPLRQEGETFPLPFAEWMPFQIGQAKAAR
jgi:hypothetical protein